MNAARRKMKIDGMRENRFCVQSVGIRRRLTFRFTFNELPKRSWKDSRWNFFFSLNFAFTNRSESSNGETNLARESYQHCRLAQQRKPQPLNSPLNHNHPRSFSLVWGRKVFFVVLNQQPPVAVATEMQPWRPRDENKQSEKLRLYSWDFETSRNHRIVHQYVTSLCPLHVFRLCEKFHAQFVPEVECIDCTIAWRYDDHQIRLVGSETLGTSSNCAFYWSRLRFTYRVSLNHRGRLKEKREMQH